MGIAPIGYMLNKFLGFFPANLRRSFRPRKNGVKVKRALSHWTMNFGNQPVHFFNSIFFVKYPNEVIQKETVIWAHLITQDIIAKYFRLNRNFSH